MGEVGGVGSDPRDRGANVASEPVILRLIVFQRDLLLW